VGRAQVWLRSARYIAKGGIRANLSVKDNEEEEDRYISRKKKHVEEEGEDG